MARPVVAVRDRQLGAFLNPFVAPTIGAAVRGFRDAVNDKGSELSKHPEDYELYQVGEWDDVAGSFANVVPAKQLALASNFVEV